MEIIEGEFFAACKYTKAADRCMLFDSMLCWAHFEGLFTLRKLETVFLV